MKKYKTGIDVGSTTAKIVILNEKNEIVYSHYQRHKAHYKNILLQFLSETLEKLGDIHTTITVTGSVGMNISESIDAPFMQEVIATTHLVQYYYPQAKTLIDIGGEDAKIVFFDNNNTGLRMNGNCAGGTGSFIDHMSQLLNVTPQELSILAESSTQTYNIAARCGVFSKTDVQNLISRNVPQSDIAASIFHAVAVQTIASLVRGHDICTPIILCGGPLTLLPSLRKAFAKYLNCNEDNFIIPEESLLLPAWGCALRNTDNNPHSLSIWINKFKRQSLNPTTKQRLIPLFSSTDEYKRWKFEKEKHKIIQNPLKPGKQKAVIGIDSGSTTTKIVVTDINGNILFTYYASNNGNPIEAVDKGLIKLHEQCEKNGTELCIVGSCSTGYGEELVKKAFNLDNGVIETIAHLQAAQKLVPEVSFILDIGGQDMKAIFIDNGTITRMELNEACSSGCGSFFENFAQTLGYSVNEFATMGCTSTMPYDLGTRCTVFMNSKVKQALREGACINDIAAGLSYSVIKNCLYKVLKIKDKSSLGEKIVVQGGTMHNDAIVKAFETLTDTTVIRSNIPELMGAYGCALIATKEISSERKLHDIKTNSTPKIKLLQCKGCENSCNITRYTFENGNNFYSGNNCEKIFTNQNKDLIKGDNIYEFKNSLLFERSNIIHSYNPSLPVIGIPRVLNMFEEFPFWHTLFSSCGIKCALSSISTINKYEKSLSSVMSDNICFPAKLAHSHIQELVDMGVDRIFLPYVIYEKKDDKRVTNTYNCPIVSGYSDVIRNSMRVDIPIDSPSITFANNKSLKFQCIKYLTTLGVKGHIAQQSVEKALKAQSAYEQEMRLHNFNILNKSKNDNNITILLAGRPYHSDPLIQHKISEMISSLGVNVISDDIVRNDTTIPIEQSYLVQQWSYVNRILKAASWCAQQNDNVHFVQITSFGCGPDAFLLDEIRDIMHRNNKPFTLLKVDDVNNIGSLRLRVRSLIESLKNKVPQEKRARDFITTPIYGKNDKNKKIIAPFFSEYISPLLTPFFELAGYDVEILPLDDIVNAELGLKYANNEICYPATLITGSIIKALQSGHYDLNNTVVAITQTGGQCRATNYVTIVKRALVSAGFNTIPVVALGVYGSTFNEQEGFSIPWHKLLPIALSSVLYADTLSRLYHSTAPREITLGKAKELRNMYIKAAYIPIRTNNPQGLLNLIEKASRDFDKICKNQVCHRIGIVGEIYLKFNPYSHCNIIDTLIQQGFEPISPTLISLLSMSLANTLTNKELKIKSSHIPSFVIRGAYKMVWNEIDKFNRAAQSFKYFIPLENIFDIARLAKKIVSLSAQFGEGWLLPGEVANMAEEGVKNIISLQPFGCIANQIIAKGIEKKVQILYPQLNFLTLDFDSGVSLVNVINRLLLFTEEIHKKSSITSKYPEV